MVKDVQVFSEKDYKSVGPASCIFSVTWLALGVKESTHLEKIKELSFQCCGLALFHRLVLHTGLTSLHLSPLDRIFQ